MRQGTLPSHARRRSLAVNRSLHAYALEHALHLPSLHPRAGVLFYFHKIPPLSGRAAAPKSEDFIESDKRTRGWTGVFYLIYEISGATLHGIDPLIKYWDFWALGFIKTDKMPWRKKPALLHPATHTRAAAVWIRPAHASRSPPHLTPLVDVGPANTYGLVAQCHA